MTQLEIIVRGNADGKYAPERAVVHLRVAVSGSEREAVYRDAIEVHARLIATLDELAGTELWRCGRATPCMSTPIGL